MGVLLTPFSVALDPSNDDIAVFIGDADFGAIGGPFHIFDVGGFAIIDHFLDPLALVLHEDYDGASGIASGEFPVLLVPGDEGDVSVVVGEVSRLVGGLGASLCLQSIEFDQFEETV